MLRVSLLRWLRKLISLLRIRLLRVSRLLRIGLLRRISRLLRIGRLLRRINRRLRVTCHLCLRLCDRIARSSVVDRLAKVPACEVVHGT